MIELIFEYLPKVAPYIFGAGGLLAYFQGRKQRRANAMASMQIAYDKFVEDNMAQNAELKQQISDLKKELKDVTTELRQLYIEHKNCA